MTIGLSPIPTRAPLIDARTGRLTREWLDFFQGLRLTVGGNAARVTGSTADPLSPVGVAVMVADAAPVSVHTAAHDAAPVAVCDMVSEVLPV